VPESSAILLVVVHTPEDGDKEDDLAKTVFLPEVVSALSVG